MREVSVQTTTHFTAEIVTGSGMRAVGGGVGMT